MLGASPEDETEAPTPEGPEDSDIGENGGEDGGEDGGDADSDDEEEAPKGKRLGAVELALIAAMLLMLVGIATVGAIVLME